MGLDVTTLRIVRVRVRVIHQGVVCTRDDSEMKMRGVNPTDSPAHAPLLLQNSFCGPGVSGEFKLTDERARVGPKGTALVGPAEGLLGNQRVFNERVLKIEEVVMRGRRREISRQMLRLMKGLGNPFIIQEERGKVMPISPAPTRTTHTKSLACLAERGTGRGHQSSGSGTPGTGDK
ncbi:hypothetical protein Bbelb_405210 [Branchiostoma belcheri]|nr:hypothetical protein Bbelb_405210 [Branchiostoma belcheri]